ncbi:hypothetical protein L210DRAFT_3499218 [Boletus edulis BED1]|uniref:Uncharacterized protein n=1 Tax=Boletus edulis BED1 TaxID=1328754 RepID=A0AAD4C8G9_BOLED|nr:hypothetical protein L210DRAFT_3499218 [Boletus edulis BED1]
MSVLFYGMHCKETSVVWVAKDDDKLRVGPWIITNEGSSGIAVQPGTATFKHFLGIKHHMMANSYTICYASQQQNPQAFNKVVENVMVGLDVQPLRWGDVLIFKHKAHELGVYVPMTTMDMTFGNELLPMLIRLSVMASTRHAKKPKLIRYSPLKVQTNTFTTVQVFFLVDIHNSKTMGTQCWTHGKRCSINLMSPPVLYLKAPKVAPSLRDTVMQCTGQPVSVGNKILKRPNLTIFYRGSS